MTPVTEDDDWDCNSDNTFTTTSTSANQPALAIIASPPSLFSVSLQLNDDGRGLLIHDYDSPTNFRYVGIDTVTDRVVVGYRDGNGWHDTGSVDAYTDFVPKTTYQLSLSIYDHDPDHRWWDFYVDGERWTGSLTESPASPIGIGIVDAEASGQIHFDPFKSVQGDWSKSPLNYTGTPAAGSPSPALSVFSLAYLTSYMIDTSITVADGGSSDGKGFLIFDYVSSTQQYKYVGIDTANDQYLIGIGNASGLDEANTLTIDAGFDLKPDVTYEVSLQICYTNDHYIRFYVNGFDVLEEVSVNGSTVVQSDGKKWYNFGESVRCDDASNRTLTGFGASGNSVTFAFYRESHDPTYVITKYPNYLTSFGGIPCLGVTYNHQAYLPNGSGGFDIHDRGEYIGMDRVHDTFGNYAPAHDVWNDYALLAWQTGGSVWDISYLRGNPPPPAHITDSFSASIIDAIVKQLKERRENVYLTITPDDIDFSYTPLESTNPSERRFAVTFTGDGQNHLFDLQFRSGMGEVIGEIAMADTLYDYQIIASDQDGDSLEYTWTTDDASNPIRPSGATLDSNGLITWIPGPADLGVFHFSITVSDGCGGEAVQAWSVTVTDTPAPNSAPVITSVVDPDGTVHTPAGQVRRDWSYQVKAVDANPDDRLRYYLIADPSTNEPPPYGMSIDRNSGAVTWDPLLSQQGDHTFWVLVVDGRGGKDLQQYSVTINAQTPVNREPHFDAGRLPPRVAVVDQLYSFDLSQLITDADGDPITFQLTAAPDGMYLDPNDNSLLVWRPTYGQWGDYDVLVMASDSHGGWDFLTYSVFVQPFNDSPVISTEFLIGGIDTEFSYPLEATDANGDPVYFSLLSGPAGMKIEKQVIGSELRDCVVWQGSTAGTFYFEILAEDARGGQDIKEFMLTLGAYTPPQFECDLPGAWIIDLEKRVSFKVLSKYPIANPANDVQLDDDARQTGMSLDPPIAGVYVVDLDRYEYTYDLVWTPRFLSSGWIKISATNNQGAFDSIDHFLWVVPQAIYPSTQPEITSQPEGPALVGQTWTYNLVGIDPDGDPGDPLPQFFLVQGPQYSSLEGNTLSWTPRAKYADKTGHFVIKMVDASGAASFQTFDLEVFNTMPSGVPVFETVGLGPVYVGDTWTYLARATDPSGNDDIQYQLVEDEYPAGMVGDMYVEPGTGARYFRLTWTPTMASITGYWATISATESGGTPVFHRISIPVLGRPVNSAPVFYTETLGPMIKDYPFTFPLDAIDYDGHTFSYSIVAEETTAPNVNIDASSGVITWTPTEAGYYQITVKLEETDYGLSSTTTYQIAVVDVNLDPCIQFGLLDSMDLDHAADYSYTVRIWDPNPEDEINASSITLNAEAVQAGLEVVPQGSGLWELRWDPEKPLPTSLEALSTLTGLAIIDGCYINLPLSILVEDGRGGEQSLAFSALPIYDFIDDIPEPVIENHPSASYVLQAGKEYHFQMAVASPPGVTLTYDITARTDEGTPEVPTGLTISDKGIIQWTPAFNQLGTYKLRVTVTNGTDSAVMDLTFTVQLAPITPVEDNLPKITSTAPNGATLDQTLVYEPTASDPANGGLLWYLGQHPKDMEIDLYTGRITWTPIEAFEGDLLGWSVPVQVYAVDSLGVYADQSFTLKIAEVNQVPVVDMTFPTTWHNDAPLDFKVIAFDPEGHALAYELLCIEDEQFVPVSEKYDDVDITVDAQGRIFWNFNSEENIGRYDFYVRVSEKYNPDSFDLRPFSIDIVDNPLVNSAPYLSNLLSFKTITSEQLFTHKFTAHDLDGNNDPTHPFVWSITGKVGNMTIDPDTGVFSWMPTASDEDKEFRFTITATDTPPTGTPLSDSPKSISLNVTLKVIKNKAPEVLSPSDINPLIGTLLAYQVEAYDPEGGPLTFAIDPAASTGTVPTGMIINPASGMLWWQIPSDPTKLCSPTPGTDYSEYTISIIVTDQYQATTAKDLAIKVSRTDTVAPVITAFVTDVSGNMISPSEDLKLYETYYLVVDVQDNSEQINETVSKSVVMVFDVAEQELPDYYVPVSQPLLHGRTVYDFTAVNQGNVHFDIKATDVDDNVSTRQLIYYVTDTTLDPPAKIAHFQDPNLPYTEQTPIDVKTVITQPLDVWGIANMYEDTGKTDPFNYELLLYRADGAYYTINQTVVGEKPVNEFVSSAEHVVLADGDADSADQRPLGTIDPALYGSGMYRLVLAIVCDCPEQHHYKAVDERIIEIRNDARPRNFELSFTDLDVKLGGIPVSLIRSYSSADASLGGGDFGPGWSLNFLNANLTVAHRLTNNLYQAMADGTRIMIRLPDGSLQRFTFDPVKYAWGDELSDYYAPRFRPDPDVTATLEIVGMDEDLLLSPLDANAGNNYQGPYVAADSNRDFIPSSFGSAFLLRTLDGIEYYFDITTGELTAMQDDAGNRIEISTEPGTTETTISTADGESCIKITRDDKGRVTAIADPIANAAESGEPKKLIQYYYGNYDPTDVLNPSTGPALGLVTFRDHTESSHSYVGYQYDTGNLLTRLYDSKGVAVLTATYDEDGHLTNLVDTGSGTTDVVYVTQYTDAEQRVLTVTEVKDASGVRVREVRDSRGNLVRQLQILVENATNPSLDEYLATVYVYDMGSRLLRESMPFVIDGAAGCYEENPSAPEDDPSAWATRNHYDGKGRLEWTIDALGQKTTYEYDNKNRIIETTTPDGNVLYNVYDPFTGDLLEEYLTEERPDTPAEAAAQKKYNHMRYEYQNGRVIKTVQITPDGVEMVLSTAVYNAFGEVTSTTVYSSIGINPPGKTTYYRYNANGKQTHTWHNWVDPEDAANVVVFVTWKEYDANDRVTGTKEYKFSQTEEITGTAEDFTTLTAELTPTHLITSTKSDYDDHNQVYCSTQTLYGLNGVSETELKNRTFYDSTGNAVETRAVIKNESDSEDPYWIVTRTLYDGAGRVVFAADPYCVLKSAYVGEAICSGTRTVYDPTTGRAVGAERYRGVHLFVTDSYTGDDTGADSSYRTISLSSGFLWDVSDTWDDETVKVSATQTIYDDLGRVRSTVDEFGTVTFTEYDPRGREIESRTQTRDQNGDVQWIATRTVYDSLNRPLYVSDPFIVQSPNSDGEGTMPPSPATKSHYDVQGREWKTERIHNLVILLGDAGSTVEASPPAGIPAPSVVWSEETKYNLLGQVEKTVGRHAPDESDPFDDSSLIKFAVTSYEYDARGRQTAIIGPAVLDPLSGQFVRLRSETHYDDFGRVEYTLTNIRVVVNAQGEEFSQTFNARKTQYVYDAEGRTIKTIYPDNSFTTQTYNKFGQLWKEGGQTAQGGTPLEKEYFYDEFGRLVQVKLPLVWDPATETNVNPTFTYGYNAFGNQVLITDPLGHETRFDFDTKGQETARYLPLSFGADGKKSTGENASGFKEEKYYSDTPLSGDLAASVCDGQMEYSVDFEGKVTAYLYDNRPGSGGRLVQKRYFPTRAAYSAGTPSECTAYTYDAFGRIVRVVQDKHGDLTTDDDQRRTLNGYDSEGRPISVENQVTALGWDYVNDIPITVVSTEGIVHYEYDPLTGQQTCTWTGSNAETTKENAITRTKYDYDALGRLASVTAERRNSSDIAENTRYIYDLMGNLKQMRLPKFTNGIGYPFAAIYEYTYDSLNRLVQLRQFQDLDRDGVFATDDVNGDGVFTDDWTEDTDGDGELDPSEDSNGNWILDWEDLNGDGEFTSGWSEDENENGTLDPGEDLNGNERIDREDRNGNGVFDCGESLIIAQYNYTLAADGKRLHALEQVDHDGDLGWSTQPQKTSIDWFYDNLGRLSREAFDSQFTGAAEIDFVTDYVYDLVGNRLFKNTENNPSMLAEPEPPAPPAPHPTREQVDAYIPSYNEEISSRYDANDRLMWEKKDVSVVDGDRFTRYEYGDNAAFDANEIPTFAGEGTRETRRTVFQGLDGRGAELTETVSQFDLQGRLSKTEIFSNGSLIPDQTITYEYDADGIRVSQTVGGSKTVYHYDKQNPTGYAQILEEKGSSNRSYTLGLDVLAQDGNYFLYDGHGSTRALFREGAIVLDYNSSTYFLAYDAFGNAVGFDQANVQAITNILYSGEQTDATGLQYLRARYYDPRTGRFNTLDPFAGNQNDPQSLHKYLYCHANPVMGIDPSGMFSLIDLLSSAADMANRRVKDARAAQGAKRVAKSLEELVKLYNKGMDLLHKAESVLDWLDTIADVLTLDKDALKSAFSKISASGIKALLTKSGVTKANVTVPRELWRPMRKVLDKLKLNQTIKSGVSEEAGEFGTMMVLSALNFKDASSDWKWARRNNGPDFIARQEDTGIWGIFEAKGGSSRLGTAFYRGRTVEEMSSAWIGHWIEQITSVRGPRDFLKKDLASAYGDGKIMLAAVVRVDIWRGRFCLSLQRYIPGKKMSGWGRT